ncbi:MAG: hypothetical protein WC423_20095 [Vulcanimicrobiota bacterium]
MEILVNIINYLAATGTNEILVAIGANNAILFGALWTGIKILARVVSKRTKSTLDDELVGEVAAELEKKK